jgi:hypothetical protein
MRRSGVRIPAAPPSKNPAPPAQTLDCRRGFVIVIQPCDASVPPGCPPTVNSAGPTPPNRPPCQGSGDTGSSSRWTRGPSMPGPSQGPLLAIATGRPPCDGGREFGAPARSTPTAATAAPPSDAASRHVTWSAGDRLAPCPQQDPGRSAKPGSRAALGESGVLWCSWSRHPPEPTGEPAGRGRDLHQVGHRHRPRLGQRRPVHPRTSRMSARRASTSAHRW